MKKIFRILSIYLIISMLFACIGCGNTPEQAPSSDSAQQGITVIDMAGNTLTLDKAPTSVFCQSSMFEQIVLALDAASLLRASSYSRTDDLRNLWFQTLYPQILDVEAAGGDKNGITNELLVAYELDLMFVATQEEYEEFTNLGIPCAVLNVQTFDDLLEAIQIVGTCLGSNYSEKASSIVNYGKNLLSIVTDKGSEITAEDKVSVYFMESRYAAAEPTLYMTWGSEAFQTDCLKQAGLDPISDDFFEGGARVDISTEQLLLSDPDAIVIGGFYEQMNYDALLSAEELSTLSAVQNQRIYRVPVGASEWTRIGVESLLLPLWYGKVFYPDLYEDIDLNATVKDFYQNVMGIELPEEYQTLILAGAAGPEND